MSDTYKHKKAWKQRQAPIESGWACVNFTAIDPAFDGRRYGNKRKAVAVLKVKDRRRRNRQARRNLDDFDVPRGANRKHEME